jgi:hypothetical protein
MKYKVFILFGADKVKIFKNDLVEQFDDIKDQINIYEFNTLEETEAFKRGVDEAIGLNAYEILTDDDISFIMSFAKED